MNSHVNRSKQLQVSVFQVRNGRAALDQATCSIKSAIKEITLDYQINLEERTNE